jgi:hypothetical protein
MLRSRQRLNLRGRHILAAEPPILQQFLSMYRRPFLDRAQSTARQLTFEDFEGFDADRGFELALASVKVRRRMVIEVHSDQDLIERADRRHLRR